ncbi:MAG: response regulator, partial [Erysipelotrichia bacterium]|nr:response regulator [Erysipelotrichia bacterium]
KINAMQSKSINDAIKATKKASELSTMLMSYLGEHNGQPHKERLMRQNENAEILPKNLEGAMILVVDDDEMVRFITVSLLEHFNFKVIEAKNGMHALELFEHFKSQIRLVVCDMIMPGMDGWQTIEALRTIAPGIPVILASGYDEAVASKDSHKEQPQVFLSKPFNSDSLQNAICKVLQAK